MMTPHTLGFRPLLMTLSLASCHEAFANACAGREESALIELALESSRVVGTDYEGVFSYRIGPGPSPALRVHVALADESAAIPRVHDDAVLVQFRAPSGLWADVFSLPPPGEYFPSRQPPKTIDLGVTKQGRLRARLFSVDQANAGAFQYRLMLIANDASMCLVSNKFGPRVTLPNPLIFRSLP
jgi:hypothetical protein